MAYDEELAIRVRKALAGQKGLSEQRKFGGMAFLLRGNMCCGVVGNDLVVRVGPERYVDALKEPHARPMDFTGRSLKGWVYVGPGGCRTDRGLLAWVQLAVNFASSLPLR